jgi:hypothetical protein
MILEKGRENSFRLERKNVMKNLCGYQKCALLALVAK